MEPLVALAVLGLLVAAGVTAGAYALGRGAKPSAAEFAAERGEGRRAALADADEAARRERARVKREAIEVGEERGRTAGETNGRAAGESEVAQQDLGPTSAAARPS